MIGGALGGLLVAVIYTVVTGRLQLSKHRITYGTPARAAALLGLVPLMFLCAVSVRYGGLPNLPGGLWLFTATLLSSIAVIYAVGWPFGEAPRDKG